MINDPTLDIQKPVAAEVETKDISDAPVKKEATPELMDFANASFTEQRPVIEDRELKQKSSYMQPLSFYNYGIDVLMYNRKVDVDASIMQHYSPAAIGVDALAREGSHWEQSFGIDDDVVGVKRPTYRSTGGHVHGKAALEMVRSINGAGGTLTIPLINTGIHITVKPANETAFIDTEFRIGQAATEIGTATTGLMLNARSGVFSKELIDLALSQVTTSNLAVGAEALHPTLMEIIDPLDYPVLVWSVLAAKFVSGHPWNFVCTEEQCKHSRAAVINFTRMLWFDKSMLTNVQLNILAKHQRSVTLEQVATYRSEWGAGKSSEHVMSDGIKIVFKRGSLREYVDTSKQWIDEIERHYNSAMTTFTSEQRRNQYLSSQMQSRRMRKYEHMVSHILLPSGLEGEYATVDDRETIRALLEEFSAASSEYESFEESAITYIDANSSAIIGYVAHPCEKCGHEPETVSGKFRSIVPVAIDRVLFTLVQQRNSIMAQLGQE